MPISWEKVAKIPLRIKVLLSMLSKNPPNHCFFHATLPNIVNQRVHYIQCLSPDKRVMLMHPHVNLYSLY